MEFQGTKGEWKVVNGMAICGIKNSERQIAITQGSDREANAKLIADAGTTATKCGLLPSTLLEQRDELLEALQELLSFCEFHGYRHSTEIYKAKQAIEKALK